ncbi:MAG: zonular occludens toxin domain-containing protein, partial [Bacteroidota bacterium]
MLTLFTGLPGAAKTLNLIKYVYENKQFQNRNIYYFGIEDLASTSEIDLSAWKELTEDQVHLWYEMDDSPVILIDEVQKIWRKRGTSSAIPFDVQHLETHRHLGVDILMTCQNPMQIDHEVRGLIQQHWHFERPANLKQGRKFEFETCVTDPKKDKFQAIQTRRYKVDKKYFGCYKSAEVHTHGARIPFKLYLVVVGLIICFMFFVYAYKVVIADRGDRDNLIDNNSLSSPGQYVQTASSTYLNQFTARYSEIPFSQPFYDDLVKPKSYPYVYGCQNIKVNDINNCTCSSLQGSRIAIPEDYCLSFINNGQHNFNESDGDYITAMNRYLPTGEACCSSGQADS